jgi:hypothetical protein
MTYEDGSVYEGNWFQGKQNGRAMTKDQMGRKQEGNWRNGVVVNKI